MPPGSQRASQAVAVALLVTSFGCTADNATTPGTPGQVSQFAVSPVQAATVGNDVYYSSTRLATSWTAPMTGTAPTRYDVTWTDQVTNVSKTVSVTGLDTTFTDLKSMTSYKFTISACTTTACNAGTSPSLTVQTPVEVFQLQGTGNSVTGLTKIVSDGNVRLHVMRYGTDAPGSLAGKLQLYYGPMATPQQRLVVGTASAAAAQATSSTYLSFTSLVNSSGLSSPSSAATLVSQVATGQAVPLSASLGGKVRLYFEAMGADGKTRIMYVDSQDAYVGQDFNSGAATTCSTTADYSAAGGCVPTVAIGIEGDATAGNTKIDNARQFKIAYPTLTDWRWDGAVGTFMVFTTATIGCSTAQTNHGYAVWSGTAWTVQYQASGCPKIFQNAQAMYPVHLGGVRYKMYYGDVSITTGKLNTVLPFLGPKKVIYADGARTGSATTVEYEDWEALSAGRTVGFLWPDGSVLSATANGYIDDFSIVAPTASLAWQIYYVAITDGNAPPITAAAVLVNP